MNSNAVNYWNTERENNYPFTVLYNRSNVSKIIEVVTSYGAKFYYVITNF